MGEIGIVVIGRNEGERLRRCLGSVVGRGHAVVYVDSGSDDGSVEFARSLGVPVVALDLSIPFSAARARNAGVERLAITDPAARYVQFVDGDCEVIEGWLEAARDELGRRPRVAVTCGRLRERFPERSLYNRLADLEWDTPVGDAESCGGISMMRLAAFRAAGGFDPTVTAGEEPELCQRLRDAGWAISRIGAEMAWHDSAILAFPQWWRRCVRGGYGGLDVATRFGRGRHGPFAAMLWSARVWTVGWASTTLAVGAIVGAIVGVSWGVAAGLPVLLAPVAQALRLGLRARPKVGPRIALAYGALTMLGKWGSLIGQALYLRDRAEGRHARLIEYKVNDAGAVPATPTS